MRWLAVCALVVALAPAALAQKTNRNGGSDPPPMTTPDASVGPPDLFGQTPDPFASLLTSPHTGELSGEVGRIMQEESCNSWTESGVNSPTVSAKRLQIPGKAAGEYQRGCGAFKGKRWTEAEGHLRRAVELYPDYSAAWVVLGQVLNSEKKAEDARSACAKAKEVDPGYVAPYLCLAELAANDANWPEVSRASAEALAIDPIGNPYSLYYAADAGLHQHQLMQAEMSAQAAVKLDKWHHLPELNLLLAQIYEAAGNVVGETTQLKEFLKVAANSRDAAKAKSTLALLEATPIKTAARSGDDPPAK